MRKLNKICKSIFSEWPFGYKSITWLPTNGYLFVNKKKPKGGGYLCIFSKSYRGLT